MGIGENGWVVNLIASDVVSVPRAMEVSVTQGSVSEGATATVVVKSMVRRAVSVELDALEVAAGASEVVSVANTSVNLSPTGKLNAGISDWAGVFVT